jgi:hypothetical protein
MHSFWHRFFQLNARFLIRQLEALFPGPPIGVVVFFHLKGSTSMGEIEVKDDETTLHSSITPLDSESQPTKLDTAPDVTSSDESVAVPHVDPDDFTRATYDVGAPGDAVITVDPHLTDADGNAILGKGTIHVVPGGVATISVDFATG